MSKNPSRSSEVDARGRINPFFSLYAYCNCGDSKRKWLDLPSFPRLVDIELTNSCNFRCQMCPTGAGVMQRPGGMMAEETYARILENSQGHKVGLRFIGWGEPMKHPKFLDFLDGAKREGHLVHVNTNGSYLTPSLADRLLDIGIDSIKFSVQGVTTDSYRALHRADFFEQLLQKAAMLHGRRAGRPKPYIQISAITKGEPPEILQAFRNRVRPICDFVNVGSVNMDLIVTPATGPHADDGCDAERHLPQTANGGSFPECPEVFDKLSVFWDGRVTACCADSGGVMQVGDLKSQTLGSIWRSQPLERYRKLLSDMEHDRLPLCRNCRDTHQLFAWPDSDGYAHAES